MPRVQVVLAASAVVIAAMGASGCKGLGKKLDALAEAGAASESKPVELGPAGADVVSTDTYPGHLVADDKFFFWTTTRPDKSAVYRALHDGTGVTALVEDLASVWSLALDGDDVYFVDGERHLKAVPKAGGAARAILDAFTIGDGQKIDSFVVDPTPGGHIFVATAFVGMKSGRRTYRDRRISSIAKAGGKPKTAELAADALVGLDPKNLFYSTGTNDLIREPRSLAGPSAKAGELGMLGRGACRQAPGGRLCCQGMDFRCLDPAGAALTSTTCDKGQLSGATLVSIDGNDAFFAASRPPRLLRCDLASGKTTSVMKLVEKVDVRGAVARGGAVYALIERSTKGAILEAKP